MSRAPKPQPAIADPGRLIALIALIEDRLQAAGGVPDLYDRAAWRAHQKKGEDIIVELVAHHGAGFRAGHGDVSVLSLAGIRTSCTGGEFGLLRNWQNAAHRRIEQMKGGAA